jgi:broad specificity phosphatase PhoE
MKHLILIRHSQIQQDPSVDAAQWQLSENGRILAQQLAPKLADYNLTRVITSHEAKAIQTGQIIAEHWQLPCHAADGLQEHDRRGVPFFASQQDFLSAVHRFFSQPGDLVFGNETAVQAKVRFDTAVTQQIAQYPDDTLALVSHGTVITLFTTYHNPQLSTISFWQSLTLPCALILTLPEFKLIHKFDMGLG